jgi:hypothetical protein
MLKILKAVLRINTKVYVSLTGKISELKAENVVEDCYYEIWVWGTDGKLITGVSHIGSDPDCLGAATGVINGYKQKYPNAIVKYKIGNSVPE